MARKIRRGPVRRRSPSAPLAHLSNEQLIQLEDDRGVPLEFRPPPLRDFEDPDPHWLAWGQEMKRRGLDFAARSSFETEAETAARRREGR